DLSQHVKVPPAKIVSTLRVDNGNEYMVYKSILDIGAPVTILPFHVRRQLEKAGWNKIQSYATGYGAPAQLFLASRPFLVSVGDSMNWT
ncbi:6434_t:CDS:2, partial [Racocetra fulgida]